MSTYPTSISLAAQLPLHFTISYGEYSGSWSPLRPIWYSKLLAVWFINLWFLAVWSEIFLFWHCSWHLRSDVLHLRVSVSLVAEFWWQGSPGPRFFLKNNQFWKINSFRFEFNFHWLSNGSSKIGQKCFKRNVFSKGKDSDDLWHWKLVLNVRYTAFRHFL